MGEWNHAYRCVNRVGDTVMSTPSVCEAQFMGSTAWVVQECLTHGRPVGMHASIYSDQALYDSFTYVFFRFDLCVPVSVRLSILCFQQQQQHFHPSLWKR